MFLDVLLDTIAIYAPDFDRKREWARLQWRSYKLAHRLAAQNFEENEDCHTAARQVIAWSEKSEKEKRDAMRLQLRDSNMRESKVRHAMGRVPRIQDPVPGEGTSPGVPPSEKP